jgi:hypothetical protein
MRILAITFALALVGCVDDGFETPEGVDTIEEENDHFGPDTHKGDIDPSAPGDETDIPQIEDGPAAQFQRPLGPQLVRKDVPSGSR